MMEYMVECSVVVELMDFLEMGEGGREGHFWVDSRYAIASKYGASVCVIVTQN